MSYGFEFRDAAGVPRLTVTEAPLRVVFSQRFPATFTGTISIPAFDSAQGGYFIKPCAIKVRGPNSNENAGFRRVTDNTSLHTYYREFGLQSVANPDLEWDNMAKTMVFSPGQTITRLPAAYPWMFVDTEALPDYFLICVHGNLVF